MNNVTNWVFDLDNTLYKAECGLFDKVHVLMGRYIEEKLGLASGEAQALRSKYYHQYGTTLRGLMMEHQIDPDDYLDYVHQINYDVVSPDEKLGDTIKNLSGKKGTFQKNFKVYERTGLNCKRFKCQGIIKKKIITNRSSFFCNICQK